MLIFFAIAKLITGVFLMVLGLNNEGYMAYGLFGASTAGWALWDLYRVTNPDKKGVSDLNQKISSLKDETQKEK